ncbi:uncharacterized protein C1orf127 homolog [Rana temporaria]|uniref:uncharacterized protein C1orf127 homolog n=1 Tax=Rana temporaria TaxID=8407 RepID=UPI001AADC631|nr:uncharacterized protein C1orf127 homolog [Rana temporaria]
MAHGFYAYSMEASCPPVSQHPGEEVVVYIPKQRVGLVKRGSYTTESLTLKNIVAGQAISITVTENKQFVMVNIPANDVLRQQDCSVTGDPIQRVQAYYSIDLVLQFAEIAYPMNWTLENYYECIGLPSKTANRSVDLAANITVNKTWVDQQSLSVATTPNPASKFPSPTNPTLFSIYTHEMQYRQNPVTSDSTLDSRTITDNSKIHLLNRVSVKPTEMSPKHSVEGTDIDTSGSGDYSESQLYENTNLESSDLGSGTQEHYPDSLLLNRQIKSKRLLELPRSLEIPTGSFLSAQTTGKNMTISINNTNPGKATHFPSEMKHKVSSPVGEHEGLENIDFRPNTLTDNLSNSSTTFTQHKVSKNITDIKRSSLSQRPMSGAVSSEMLPRDTQTDLDEREKDGLLWLSPRGHQIKKEEEEIKVTVNVSGHEKAQHPMSIPTVKGPNRQPKDAQFSSEANTGHHQSPSDNQPKNPQYSVVWSTSSLHTEEILNKTTSEIEMTVSDEQLLLAALG